MENSISQEFNEFLSFKTPDEELQHDATMISLRFISEINEILQSNCCYSKKDLAEMLGTSPSFVTQLFNGDKKLNMDILAKFQKILKTKFSISTCEKENQFIKFSDFDEIKKFKHFDDDGFWVFRNKDIYEKNNIDFTKIDIEKIKSAYL